MAAVAKQDLGLTVWPGEYRIADLKFVVSGNRRETGAVIDEYFSPRERDVFRPER